METSSQMLVFVKVVDNGSISAAARAAGQTPSAVSKQIGDLEDRMGHRLLHRTRTGISPTAEGRDFYARCKAVAEKVEEAEAHMQRLDGRPRGRLRVTSSVAFGKAQLIPALPEFLAEHPEVTVSLEVTDRPVDLEAEDIDAAIRFSEQLDDPGVVVRKIMENERILCASPAYLAEAGVPASFDDLVRFNCLRTMKPGGSAPWRSVQDGREHTVDVSGNFEGNSADVLLHAALAGLGIARLSRYLVEDRIRSGDLVRILPEYHQKNAEVVVIFAEKRLLAPRTRAFVDFLVTRFRGEGLGAASGTLDPVQAG